jgi:hypothetical protein
MSIHYRQLNKDDVAAYKILRLEMLSEHPESYGGSYEESSKEGDDFYLGRIENNCGIYGAYQNENLIGEAGYSSRFY